MINASRRDAFGATDVDTTEQSVSCGDETCDFQTIERKETYPYSSR